MSHAHREEFDGPWWRYPLLRNGLIAAVLAAIGFILESQELVSPRGSPVLYLVAIPLAGYHWAREAIEDLIRDYSVGIDLLMLTAMIGASLLGLLNEAAALAVLYALAEGLEDFTYARTRSAIRGLLSLAPKTARVVRDGIEGEIPAEALSVGDRFLVRAGESFATDGLIRLGRSTVDESAVTGESIPIEKEIGDPVYAGTLNQVGAIEVEATAAFVDNTLSKVIHLVEAAQTEKGRAQQWVERFGHRYSPIVLASSLGLLLIPAILSLPFAPWAHRAVVLLVAAAPCALVISTPIAMAAGIARAGRRGILVKGGAHLEHLAQIRMVAFDKTGTLTEGRPRVTNAIPLDTDLERLLAIASGIERLSEHPLARAVVAAAKEHGVIPLEASDSRALSGAGTEAIVKGASWYVGSPALFRDRGHDLTPHEEIVRRLEEEGKTTVLVGTDRVIAGVLAIRDTIRPTAAAAVRSLQASGFHVAMLTGDNPRTAQEVARLVGIDDVQASLKPGDKLSALAGYERRWPGGVLMVGDGVNDAPALAAASCGIAMGAVASDAAIEAADVALMSNDLSQVSEALSIARQVQRVSRQNVVFSLTLLAVLIPAALFNLLGVAAAVAAHEAGELIAVANGLRAGRQRGISS